MRRCPSLGRISRHLVLAAVASLLLAGTLVRASDTAVAAHGERLVVCADPNDLPFSDRSGRGFENRLAQLVARDMATRVEYHWWTQRRGYVRKTLNAGQCDLWPGIAAGVDTVSTTRPYYTSTYVFVTRADRKLTGLTLDDARLRSLSIGVQMIGNDAMNTPPAHAIAERGIVDQVHGFMVYRNLARPNASAPIIDAVATGRVDVALVWGPVAGYFATHSPVPLRLEPVTPDAQNSRWPMTYSIAIGVRKGDLALRDAIDAVLVREQPRIQALLRAYHIPQAALPQAAPNAR